LSFHISKQKVCLLECLSRQLNRLWIPNQAQYSSLWYPYRR